MPSYKRYCASVLAVLLLFASAAGFAETSSKGKKAEKLIAAGNIAGAVEIYKELMEKYAQKNPELAKEGKEGMANCLVLTAQESQKNKNYADAKTKAEEVLASYADTASVKGAQAALAAAQIEVCRQLLADGNYSECKQQARDASGKIAADTPGADTLNGIVGDCLFFQGKAALGMKKYADALEKFESVVKDYPKSEKLADAKAALAEALYQTGNASLEEKKYLDALAAFQRIVKEFPDSKDTIVKVKAGMVAIGEAMYGLADEALKAGKYEDAIKSCETALTASTEDEFTAKCKYAIGTCYRLGKQNDKAVQCYNDVITYVKAPVVAMAYHDLYLIYMDLGNRQDALAAIRQAVALDPDNSDYLYKQAQLMYDMGQAESSRKAFTTLLGMLQGELDKTYLNKEELQYKLGQTYLRLGNYTEAAVEFDKALTRNPSMTDARIGLAAAQFNDKNFSGANATYASLIKQLSAEFEELQNRVNAEKNSMEAARQLEAVRKRIAYFHFQNGLSFEQLGDYDNALAECRLGLEGVPTQDAATTLKRIQTAAQQDKKAKPAQQ